MTLYFVTWNPKKFAEAKMALPELEQLDIDLPEIQSLDPQEILRYKLDAAIKSSPTLLSQGGGIIVEDTSLVFHAWNGLPGPFVKWYLESVGYDGIWKMLEGFENRSATAICTIGYTDGIQMEFFQWTVEWTIVQKIIDTGFGRDAMFRPDGFSVTFGHMTMEEKLAISHRGKALHLLTKYLSLV